MVNIIIISEMRVGSRWIHYLLRDLLGMKVSGELDAKELPHCDKLVQHRFSENRIVKFHHATQNDILNHISGDYKIIGIVRNPRDRITSWTFHQRYKPSGKGLQVIKDAESDRKAVKITFDLKQGQLDNERQFILMVRGFSTKLFHDQYSTQDRYIWTCYHWLLKDTFKEIKTIVKFLGLDIPDKKIREVIQKNSFKNRSGRVPGKEVRDNEWFRKGVEHDYEKFFDEEMIQQSRQITDEYWSRIRDEDTK